MYPREGGNPLCKAEEGLSIYPGQLLPIAIKNINQNICFILLFIVLIYQTVIAVLTKIAKDADQNTCIIEMSPFT